ncbi:hypothetical protein P7K49_026155, partial [Saguinus oedipus]
GGGYEQELAKPIPALKAVLQRDSLVLWKAEQEHAGFSRAILSLPAAVLQAEALAALILSDLKPSPPDVVTRNLQCFLSAPWSVPKSSPPDVVTRNLQCFLSAPWSVPKSSPPDVVTRNLQCFLSAPWSVPKSSLCFLSTTCFCQKLDFAP